jgi:hypothetical protein
VSDKALRELIDEIKHYRMLADPEWEDEASLARSVDAAESALQNGGWKKWPQEKPEKIGDYIVFNGAIVFAAQWTHTTDNPVDRWIGGNHITHWQPLPEAPDDQE